MGLRVVPDAAGRVAVGGVALHDGAADRLHHGPPELRAQEVLVALLAGVDLHRHLAGQLDPQGAVQLNHLFRGDLPCKIDLCSHNKTSYPGQTTLRPASYGRPQICRLYSDTTSATVL